MSGPSNNLNDLLAGFGLGGLMGGMGNGLTGGMGADLNSGMGSGINVPFNTLNNPEVARNYKEPRDKGYPTKGHYQPSMDLRDNISVDSDMSEIRTISVGKKKGKKVVSL